MARPSFAFLSLEAHPYAGEMLRELLAAGFVPGRIVEERSEVARVERAKFQERIAGHAEAATVEEQASAHGIELTRVERHTSESVLAALGSEPLDLLVLGGTRILRGPLLTRPASGVINSHPGLLPDCRGSASVAWSVYHDIPIGSTTHLCDDGIDTGDVLLRRRVPVRRGMTYEDLCHATLVLSGVLMREVLEAHAEGRFEELRQPQAESQWPTFKNAPEEVLEVVREKLGRGTYACYGDA